jgi:hypothetical protein
LGICHESEEQLTETIKIIKASMFKTRSKLTDNTALPPSFQMRKFTQKG